MQRGRRELDKWNLLVKLGDFTLLRVFSTNLQGVKHGHDPIYHLAKWFIIFHHPRLGPCYLGVPFPFQNTTFWGFWSCKVAIIWPGYIDRDFILYLEAPPTTSFKWIEMVISNHFSMVMILVHHPNETSDLYVCTWQVCWWPLGDRENVTRIQRLMATFILGSKAIITKWTVI